MRFLLPLLIPVVIFVAGVIMRAGLAFACRHDGKWWGGAPMWLAIAIPTSGAAIVACTAIIVVVIGVTE